MSTTTEEILELLHEDLISHGFLTQCLFGTNAARDVVNKQLPDKLNQLLATNEIEIGNARMTKPDYVEFEAWRGTVPERIIRAIDAVANAEGQDKEFAYWLCLRCNVDRFEEDQKKD
jgi:hypothetical protein